MDTVDGMLYVGRVFYVGGGVCFMVVGSVDGEGGMGMLVGVGYNTHHHRACWCVLSLCSTYRRTPLSLITTCMYVDLPPHDVDLPPPHDVDLPPHDVDLHTGSYGKPMWVSWRVY